MENSKALNLKVSIIALYFFMVFVRTVYSIVLYSVHYTVHCTFIIFAVNKNIHVRFCGSASDNFTNLIDPDPTVYKN